MEREKKTDRRTLYTKRVIREAFTEALKKKDYDKITVSELCSAADINRSTFYLHYETALSVFDELLDEVLLEMLSKEETFLNEVSLEELFRLGSLSRSETLQNPQKALLLSKGFTYPRFIERYSEEAAKRILKRLHGAPELSDTQRFEIVKGLFYADAMLNQTYAAHHRTADLSAYNDLINRYILLPSLEKLE